MPVRKSFSLEWPLGRRLRRNAIKQNSQGTGDDSHQQLKACRIVFSTTSLPAVGHVTVPVVPPKYPEIEVALARTRTELNAAFRLLYEAYVSAGLTARNEEGIRRTPYHLLPTTEVFVAKYVGEVISTLTMIADNPSGLPMESMYAEEIEFQRQNGLKVAEIGCLADRRDSPTRFRNVIGRLSCLVVQVAQSRGMNGLVLATHPRHARFYKRALGFEQFGGLKSCPYAEGNPAVALVMNFERLKGTSIHERLFGEPFTASDMQQTAWTEETSQYLQELSC
ncbi:N-acyl amino acid synthase FeeM domain-containing protein [Aureliella helgolandensis]|uniref:N-acyl amino acid synthase FeeM catalytic core domain-containing protein n=1 Tax=Aureliella helgolandensis TaxID=2527968 RepID=A0A518GE24_9BACT|nr:long-chain N-acyl amino acid synthase [Aureliella helgolandensis]QDV26851.1 hypothetical protein Q31a_52300 [Aureliella helgolandensis]